MGTQGRVAADWRTEQSDFDKRGGVAFGKEDDLQS